MSDSHLFVVNRGGKKIAVDFNASYQRIKDIVNMKPVLYNVDCEDITRKIISGISNGIATSALDILAAEIADGLVLTHYEYEIFASRIYIDNYIKNQINNLRLIFPHVSIEELKKRNMYYSMLALYMNIDENGEQYPLIHPKLVAILKNNNNIESLLDYGRDYLYSYSGFKLLEESYLKYTHIMIGGVRTKIHVDLPQHMHMRVAIGLFYSDPEKISNIDHFAIAQKCPWLYQIKEFNLSATNLITKNVDWKFIIYNLVKMNYNISKISKLKDAIKECTQNWIDLLDRYINRPDTLVDDIAKIERCYHLHSNKYITQATPTLFNIMTLYPQCSSCFLSVMPDDSIEGFAKFYKRQQKIQKYAGGHGSAIHNIRSEKSYIRGTNGKSNGIIDLMKVIDAISVHIDQGGNKRPGSNAIYLELWHADIKLFIASRFERTNAKKQAKELFPALWMCDEFFRCLKRELELNEQFPDKAPHKLWHLMDPNVSPYLNLKFDAKFTTEWIETPNETDHAFTFLYRKYISEGKFVKVVSAEEIVDEINKSLQENSLPYMLCKDSINRKNNQANLGTIECSNLCTEIMEYSSHNEVAVCNIMSIDVGQMITDKVSYNPAIIEPVNPIFTTGWETNIKKKLGMSTKKVKTANGNGAIVSNMKYFNWTLFEQCIRQCVVNLNQLIDITMHPFGEARYSDKRNRAIGIGIQGWADMLINLKIEFISEDNKLLNFYIFEFMYYVALDESVNLAIKNGTYQTYHGSPMSNGKLQFDLWVDENPKCLYAPFACDWDKLRHRIKEHGVRNSLLIAQMPTASTATLMGACPAFEPYQGLIYKRKNKVGDNIIVAKEFMKDLMEIGLWDRSIANAIMIDRYGSLSGTNLDSQIKNLYKTAFEINSEQYIMLSLIRAPFIDQGQSLNWFIENPKSEILFENMMTLWENGAKNISYYVRAMATNDAKKLQVTSEKTTETTREPKESKDNKVNLENEPAVCLLNDPDCESCKG